METQFKVLEVEEGVHVVEEKASIGLVQLRQANTQSHVDLALQNVADGVPPALCSWHPKYRKAAVAVSYVHTDPTQWYGRISRGKFALDTRRRLVAALADREVEAFWLDQCLAQRKGDGEAGWAVLGLLPYAAMPVLVVGNYKSLSAILESYVRLQRFPTHVLDGVVADLLEIIPKMWTTLSNNPSCSTQDLGGEHSPELYIDFVEMCRFWPMMERAMAMQAKGFFFENHTFQGLNSWVETLRRMSPPKARQSSESAPPLKENVSMVVDDLLDLVYCTQARPERDAHCSGHDDNVLTALATVTGAMGSGALGNAKLYQPADRDALLLAGMCFTLLATSPRKRMLNTFEVVQILEDPFRAFARISERIPATFTTTAQALSAVRVLYRRPAAELPEVPHATLTDEVSKFGEDTQMTTSRRWNGQWELVPQLSQCMYGDLIDIGERAMNSEPYEDIVLKQTFSKLDITGKAIRAALCSVPLTVRSCIRMIAFSSFNVVWDIGSDADVLREAGLGDWHSSIMFFGLCNLVEKVFSVEAVLTTHMATTEREHLYKGQLSEAAALSWVKELGRRAICPLEKGAWIQQWISTNFAETECKWYCPIPFPVHHFTWVKWLDRRQSPQPSAASLHNSAVGRFVKVSCVGVDTLATASQLFLEDVVQIVRATELIAMQTVVDSASEYSSMETVYEDHHRRSFEICLGALTGIYHLRERHHGIRRSSVVQLMLPAYKMWNEAIVLCTPDILDPSSDFMKGLSTALPEADSLEFDHAKERLQRNRDCSSTFWQTKDAILNTAHVEGLVISLRLLCVTTGIHDTQGEASSSADDELPAEPSIAAGNEELMLKVTDAIKKFCIKLETPHATRISSALLVEHIVVNARRDRDHSDWRLPPLLRMSIIESIRRTADPSCDALIDRVNAHVSMLDRLHKLICHVREGRIEVEPAKSFKESTLDSFENLLDIGILTAEERVSDRPRLKEVLGHADLDNIIPSHETKTDTTQNHGTWEKQLALTFDFEGRS